LLLVCCVNYVKYKYDETLPVILLLLLLLLLLKL